MPDALPAGARNPDHPFLPGDGEAAGIIAGFDWAATSLGPIGGWPAALKATISLILASPVPIVTLWGEDGVMIYNDGYSIFAGGRHPSLFGSKVREGWPEVADFNDNIVKVCLGGGNLAYREHELILSRRGKPESVWLDLDYSPVRDEAGTPIGVIAIVVEITGKFMAERALRAERESLRQMFQQAPGLIAVLSGPDFVIDMANAAYLRLVGDRDVIGKPLAVALPEVVGQGFLELLKGVRATGKAYAGNGIRLLLEQSPGAPPEERFVDFVYQPIVTETGAITGIFVQGHDVTEQRRGELALRETESRFRLVADNAPVMLWMSDLNGKCLYLNRAQREFWAVAEDAIEAFDWNETVHPEDRAALFEPFQAAMAARTPFTVECRLRRADGGYRLISTNAQPRFQISDSPSGGDFLGMIGVNIDITEMRQAEEALRRETRILDVLNQTGIAIAGELNLDDLVQMVSDAGVELVGAQFGAFYYDAPRADGGQDALQACSGAPLGAAATLARLRATPLAQTARETARDAVVRLDDLADDPALGSYLAVPVAARSGEALGGLAFGHRLPGMFKPEHEELLRGIAAQAATALDNARLFQAAEREIADRRRAEAALQTLNATLEQRVADEVAEHSRTEEALRQSQKMDAIGKLTGGVAHDFNNLLQVISGNLQLLGKEIAGNERAQRRVENALAGVSRGSKLASQLLAFGRRQALEPKVVHIGRLVSDMSDMLRRTIGEQIEIETMVAGGLWNTLIDPAQLENAMLNLAINARDAIDEKSGDPGKLTIEVGNAFLDDSYVLGHADVTPGQYVVLAVTDNGAGMPPAVLAQAFEPFFSTKPQGKGTGLGLSMIYGFVKQSGGHLKIYSEVGHGTTVKLYLPRSHQSEDVLVDTASGPITGGTETVLVAEDDDQVRNTVVEMLGDLGYRVLTARDAASALSVIESGIPIDLLFTDVVMPGTLKSPELARKARERLPHLAVLFTSGYTENSIVHGGRLDPGVELLSKPYTREALARKVQHVLANAAQKRPAPARPATPVPVPADPVTVLFCEDDPLIRMSTAELLRDLGLEVMEAGSALEALALLKRGGVDVLLTDIGLPDMAGTELARQARGMVPTLPLIFATGHRDVPEAAGLGNAAVVHKPFDEDALHRAIRTLLGQTSR